MKVFKTFCLSAAAVAVMTSGVQAGPLADATADALWGIELGGYLDMSYTYNFNDTDTAFPGGRPGGGVNVGRFFDTDDDEFNFHAFQLYIDRLPEEVGEVGFRADIMVGEDSNLVASDGAFDFGDEFNMYQAYISYIAPVGNGLTLDLGRWVTPYGYEVIESPANDNFSRSFLFAAQPKTHTGLRATYPINDQFEVLGAISQGWDVVEDDNDSVSFHAALRWTPMETLYIQNAISYGPEIANNDDDYTFLYDLVVSYTAMEQLTVGGNFNWAETEDAITTGDAEWWGLALYGRYDFNEQVYAAVRGEYIEDEDGLLTMVPGGSDMWEITATLGYEVTDGLEARLEYRHDDSDSNVFLDDGGLDDSQDTISAEVIYSF